MKLRQLIEVSTAPVWTEGINFCPLALTADTIICTSEQQLNIYMDFTAI